MDGDYNSARLLPEMTHYGSGQLTNAKFYGSAGMESLRAMLKHADHYGLKYTFVRDPYYEPLLAFAGWRKDEVYDNGNVSLWVKDGIAPARPTDLGVRPTAFEGLLWGTLPIGSSILALLLVILLPDVAPADLSRWCSRLVPTNLFCGRCANGTRTADSVSDFTLAFVAAGAVHTSGTAPRHRLKALCRPCSTMFRDTTGRALIVMFLRPATWTCQLSRVISPAAMAAYARTLTGSVTAMR